MIMGSLFGHRQHRPSLSYGQVGSCIRFFEACSAFTHVTARMLAESSKTTLYTRGFDGFVASTAAPIATGRSDPVAGRELHPLRTSAFSRRTVRSIVSDARRLLDFGGLDELCVV